MITGLSAPVRAHAAIAIKMYIGQLARDGFAPPAGLAAFADRLLIDDTMSPMSRARAFNAARCRRYRQRRKQRQAA